MELVSTIKYRPDIDGLRAFAVIAVILFHYRVPNFDGGFVGVDVFFVISGYLISSIIFNDLDKNNFLFFVFYKRRILRIFPALYFVIFISTMVSMILYDYESLTTFGKSVISIVVFASNFYFSKSIGYFTLSSHQITLLHTWTLALEEQFYFVFPIVIFLLHKYQKLNIKYYIVAALFLSLSLCIILGETGKFQFTFYMLPTRAWEFLIGTLLAIRLFPKISNIKLCHFLSIVGFVSIILSIFLLSSVIKYPNLTTLFPVLGAALIIYCGESYSKSIANKFLKTPFIVFVGKISYSLYLWHWVLYVFYNYISLDDFNWLSVIILLALSFLLSIFSWHFIEQPFRTKKEYSDHGRVFKIAALISCLFFLGCTIMVKSNGFPSRFLDNERLMESKKDSTFFNFANKWGEKASLNPDSAIIPFIIGKEKKPKTIFLGDSHAAALGAGLIENTKTNMKGVYMASFGGFIPLHNINRTYPYSTLHPPMSVITEKVLKFILEHPEIKTVVMVGRWPAYVGYRNKYDDRSWHLLSTSYEKKQLSQIQLFKRGLRETIITLHKSRKKIILVTDVPLLINYPANYMLRKRITDEDINSLTPKRQFYNQNNSEIITIFNQLKNEGLVDEIVNLHEQFFSGNNTIIEENNKLLYRDDDHLSYWGALKVKGLFKKYIENVE